jgi:hypothetical protein
MGSVLEKYLLLLGFQWGYAFTPEGMGGGSANGPKVLDAPCPALWSISLENLIIKYKALSFNCVRNPGT